MNYESLFRKISEFIQKSNSELYAVGGFVRDQMLERHSKDIDFVVIGDGIDFAKKLYKYLSGSNFAFFKRFETARFTYKEFDLEFVSARKESYTDKSRKPIVKKTDLFTDLSRRDFTINAMAYSLKKDTFMNLIDPFNGKTDLEKKVIRTPADPDISFTDDPLRILRAIRFASRLNFSIEKKTFQSLKNHKHRLEIVSKERIRDEYLQMLTSQNFYSALEYIEKAGLQKNFIIPFQRLNDLKFLEANQFKSLNINEKLSLIAFILNLSENDVLSRLKKFKFSNNDITEILFYIKHSNDVIRILCTNEINKQDYNHFLFKTGKKYESLLILFSKLLNSQKKVVHKERIEEISSIDKINNYSNLKLALDGNEISGLTHLERKNLGDFIKHLNKKILDMEIDNTKSSIKSYIKSLKPNVLTSLT